MAKKKVLIVGTDAINASSSFETAKFGFVENGATFSALASGALSLSGGEEDVYAFHGTDNVGPMSEGDVKKVTTIAYSAGTAQASTATIALDDDAASVKIINTTAGTANLPVKTFEAPATQASAAAAAGVIEALMDTEFAKTDSEFYGFTASVSSAVVTIGAPINSHFKLSGNDASAFADTAVAVPSVGTAAQITALEKQGWIDSGVFGLGGSNIVQPATQVSGNYDVVLVEGTVSSSSKAVGNAQNYDDYALYICIPDGYSTLTPANVNTQITLLKA